ncbi:MAG: RNA polymerase sigma factor [Sciscionella sp.]
MTAAATNTDLLRLALEGDPDSSDAVLGQYSRYLRRVAYSYGLDHDVVEAIVQATWLGLIQHAHSVRHPEELAGWLQTTLERRFLRTISRQNHQRSTGDPSTHLNAASPPSGGVPQSTGLTEFRRALAALSVRDRRLLLQFASDGGRVSAAEAGS